MLKWIFKAAPVQALALYMTARPNRFVKTRGYLPRQLRSVAFGLRSCKGCAEGFRVLGVTHMHCFLEAESK